MITFTPVIYSGKSIQTNKLKRPSAQTNLHSGINNNILQHNINSDFSSISFNGKAKNGITSIFDSPIKLNVSEKSKQAVKDKLLGICEANKDKSDFPVETLQLIGEYIKPSDDKEPTTLRVLYRGLFEDNPDDFRKVPICDTGLYNLSAYPNLQNLFETIKIHYEYIGQMLFPSINKRVADMSLYNSVIEYVNNPDA